MFLPRLLALASFVFATVAFAASALLPIAPDLVVATDGTGKFITVQSALDSIPADNRERLVVFIKDGTYREKVRIDARFVTLRGESRDGTRIEFPQGREEFNQQPDPLGFAVVNINGDDSVLENLTVENTHGVIGKHAFAIYGKADRTVITDCNVYSQGNDTLSLWKGDTGRYYHARLKVRGSVDFICPRGWCYITDSDIYEVNPGASAAIWHDGSKDRDQKFVLRNCRFDGVEGWRFARHHADAQFYLLDCTFSAAMRDLAPKRVIYPLGDKPITEADIQRNRELDLINRWGERFYYHNVRRTGGDYAWHTDNLATAEGAPKPEQITAKWTFAGTWDPENTAGPAVMSITREGPAVKVRFSENVTVKGRPTLVLQSGSVAAYVSGSGSDTLVFRDPVGKNAAVLRIELGDGVIIATEAHATLRTAHLTLPAP
jgi:pectinesterase